MSRQADLTPKQAAFVSEYLRNGGNAAAAFRSAYKTQASPQCAAEQGSRLVAHGKIAPILAEAAQKAAAATQTVIAQHVLTKERLVTNLARLANYDLRHAFEWDAEGNTKLKASEALSDDVAFAITSIERRADGSLKLTFADKRAAAMDMAKLMGWIEDKKSVRFIRRIEDLTDSELAALADGDRGG